MMTRSQAQQTGREDIYQFDHGRRYVGGEWKQLPLAIVKETPLSVFVNKKELVTLLCTPNKLNQLLMGFLHLEGLIEQVDDVAYMRVCVEESVAEIQLVNESVALPTRRVLTSGCGGGIGLSNDIRGVERLISTARLTTDEVFHMARLLNESASIYPVTGGIHASILSDGQIALAAAEDVGRHNTIDKIDGECLLKGTPTAGHFLVTSGRISSEMLIKAAKMRVPIVVTRTSPTHRALLLAEELGITLVGYLRGTSFLVYSHGYRIEGYS